MARPAAVSVENNFTAGLVTEASGLNFPENACTETYNCEFSFDGSVSRRLGFDFESDFNLKTINRNGSAVTTYIWKNVAGNGDLTLLAMQVGLNIYFYEVRANQGVSPGEISSIVTLTPNVGATDSALVEVQYSDGNGYLIVTHPHCDPLRISYNTGTQVATGTPITIQIRDFEGASADPYTISERPTSTLAALNDAHEYNLRNQGWNTTNLTAWDTAQTTMPSSSDVMWSFKDASNNFDASTAALGRVVAGNTPAPKGHFVLNLFNQDRDTAAGTTGVAATTTSFQRPSTSTFFAGRVWYSGINYVGFNSKVYYTQIIERVDQYGAAYQVNDPTAEDLFDLLPSDGGVIAIPEAGTIYKLFTLKGGIAVFAENGVWFITGNTGVGFKADDYSVQKIAKIPTLTASSFVDVAGYPCWWNSRGIYLMSAGGESDKSREGIPTIQSITDQRIKSFYEDIPLNSKRFAKGIYHYLDNHVRWVYRSTSTSDVTEQYEFDRVLNLNLQTGGFYPWTISESDVKVNSILPSDLISGNIATVNIIDEVGNNVIDNDGNQVVAFVSTGTETSPFDKYLVSYASGGSHKFTFADKINANYRDWVTYDDVGVDYDSYLVTGYKVRGQAIRKFQNNWVRVFSNTENPVSYYFQAIWDYANTQATGRWSQAQLVEHTDTDYSILSKRLKVRGHGLALQFKIESVSGQPFDLIGWSALQSGNVSP